MSIPNEPDDVKLLTSIFSPEKKLIEEVIERMGSLLGPVDWKSPWMFFDRTRYYEKEMGWPLHRLFITFQNLIRPEHLVDIKIKTNNLEMEYLYEGRRRINIDPGYISLERLVLATGKNYTHRIYLSKGIYADLTLVFNKGSFRPLDWTYKDYAGNQLIEYLNQEREKYKKSIRRIMD